MADLHGNPIRGWGKKMTKTRKPGRLHRGTSPWNRRFDSATVESLKEATPGSALRPSPLEAKVLRCVSVSMNTDHTLEESRQAVSRNRERIRQIEAKALRKLHAPDAQRSLCAAFLRRVSGAVNRKTPANAAFLFQSASTMSASASIRK